MIVLWSGIISHGRNKLLELQENAIAKSCGVRFVALLQVHNTLLLFYRLLWDTCRDSYNVVWQRHTRFFH